MYEAFYGFREKPFSMLPDPGFLFLSKKHQTALTLLEYGLLNHVGFCVISGEPGAGKTTILRALLERIGDDVTVGLITNTHQSFGGLLDWILSAFDLHRPDLTHVEKHQIFMEFLIEEYANNRTVLLIVDEAQNMTPEVLEELRMLSNVNSAKDQLLQVVLAGQPALKESLHKPELKQFAQRIAVDYHLNALGLKETCGYIQHRLLTAGAEKDIFTPAACERIFRYSGGTPRLINLLCETVLVYGFADQRQVIDVDLVDEMVQERMKDSVVPIVNRDIAKQDNNKQSSERPEKDFPWIRPEGGTEGLKPSVNTGAVEKQQGIKAQVKSVAASSEAINDENKIDKEVVAGDDKPLPVYVKKDEADISVNNNKAVKVAQKSSQKTPQKTGTKPAASSPVTVSTSTQVFAEKEKTEDNNETGKHFIKYGVIAGIFALVIIVLVLWLNDESKSRLDATKNEVLELQKQREKEALQLKQLQIEAEVLRKERDAAFAKIEKEQRAKREAEKLAAEKAALAIKTAEDKRRLEQQKRIAEAKKRERLAKKAKAKAEREKREAAKLEEERRLKEQQEARHLELEWIEEQRRILLESESRAGQ